MFALPRFAEAEVPVIQIAFCRYLAGFLVVLVVAISRRQVKIGFTSQLWPIHGLRVVCSIASLLAGLLAIQTIPLATAQSIAMTSGVFVFLFAAMFLKEVLSWSRLFAGVVCIAGGLIAADVNWNGAGEVLSVGALFAFANAVFWAGELIVLKFLADRDRPITILLAVNLMAAIVLGLYVLPNWQALSFHDLALFLSMGFVAIVGQFCNIRGFQIADASFLTPIKYAGIVVAGTLGFFLFDEQPGITLVIGACFIAVGGLILSRKG
jgi:drug/metabolite transporter (DMT)-like permease